MSFRLPIYSLRRIKDKNKKNNKSKSKLGDYCLKRIYWFGIGLELLSASCLVKIYAMVEWPCMFRNVWSISACFDIPDMFFLTSFKTLDGFAYITPIYKIPCADSDHIRLMFNGWSEFGRIWEDEIRLWRFCTPLQPSMLTIILSRFENNIVFFLNNRQRAAFSINNK